MTRLTASALREALAHLTQCFSGYRERVSAAPRSPENRLIFEQLFAAEAGPRPELVVSLVQLLRLPGSHFGAIEFKALLPHLCTLAIEPRPAVDLSALADGLGRYDFEKWPAAERTAIWDYLLVFLRSLLEDFSGRKAPPWGAYGYFRDLSRATPHVAPALLSWEMTEFVTSLLHLAAFTQTWVEDQPLRELKPWGREPTATIDRWLATTGRDKLRRALVTYEAEPFAVDFSTALRTLDAGPR